MKDGSKKIETFADTLTYATADLLPWQRTVIRTIERVFGKRQLRNTCNHFLQINQSAETFWADALKSLRLSVRLDGEPLSTVPREGGVLIVANHPYGIVDGVGIASTVCRIRKDIKVIAWDLLTLNENSRGYFLPMNLAENDRTARKQNLRVRKEAVKHLQDGGVVLVFPSGMAGVVETPFSEPIEAPWSRFMTRIIFDAQVPVLPMFVHGHNSRLFHVVSLVSQTLRLSLFFREINRMVGQEVRITVGETLEPGRLGEIGDVREVTEWLYRYTLALESRSQAGSEAASHTDIDDLDRDFEYEPVTSERILQNQ